MPTILLALPAAALATLAVSYVMVRASNRSALWNIWFGATVVLIVAITLVVAAGVIVRWVFPEFY